MTLHEYWKVIRHRWILILLCTLLLAGMAWLITPATTDTTRKVGSYTATTTLLVGSRANAATPQGSFTENVSLGRVALFVTTGEVPKRAAAALNYRDDPALLAAGLTVAPVDEAQALTISTVASDGQRAADVANTFARETVRYFDEGHTGTGNTQLTVLQEATPIPNESRVGFALPAGKLPRTLLGALLGLLIGFGVALVLDRLDSRLRTRQEVHDALRLPVIAQVPRLRRSDRLPGKLAVVAEPLGEYANGYRAARTALMHIPGQTVEGEWAPKRAAGGDPDAAESRPAKVILVTSAFESEGKTTSVANLAASFAETGQSVLVLDCDLRSPDTHNHFDVPQGAGISDFLVQGGNGPIDGLIRPTNVPGVHIMTAGTRLDHPAALTSRVGPMLAQARELADVVLIDTAPLLAASDVFDVLPLVDTVLLVVRSGRLTGPAGQRVSELLGRFQVPVTGAILLGAPARRSEGYGTRYGYGYGEDPRKKERKARAAARPNSTPSERALARMRVTDAGPGPGASSPVADPQTNAPAPDSMPFEDPPTHKVPTQPRSGDLHARTTDPELQRGPETSVTVRPDSAD